MCRKQTQTGHQSRCLSRRCFLAGTTATSITAGLLAGQAARPMQELADVTPVGPASKVVPTIKATFVRRRGEYGMRWPGAVYDGEAARKQYTDALLSAAKKLGITVDLRPDPIYSVDEAKAWVAAAADARPDGLLVIVLDRQQHAWPTATLAAESAIPTIIFSPLGTSFTTNTCHLAGKKGCIICATDDFSEVVYGLKMVQAHRKLEETRFVVLRGNERIQRKVPHLGTTLQYIPAADFLKEYLRIPVTDAIKAVAKAYVANATRITSGTYQDVVNGVKSYAVARHLLRREEGDAITMDCLGALGKTKVSLPCIAWSYMLDHGVPAACEADINASTTHALVQYLFDRPGFQQDPVAETSRGTLIGAHCTCPTRLEGFDKPPVTYDICNHHGKRDAVPRPVWEVGHRATVAQFVLNRKDEAPPQMIISAGEVLENRAVPPAGGCVVSVELKLDGVTDCLAYPGFHQIFFYGDYKRQLLAYCQLYGIEPLVVDGRPIIS